MSEPVEFKVDLGHIELSRAVKAQILSFDKEKDTFQLYLINSDMKVQLKRAAGEVTDELGMQGKHITLSTTGTFQLKEAEEPVKRTSGCVVFNGKDL